MKKLLFTFLFLLIAATAQAKTYYLDNTTTGCSNGSTTYDPATDTCGSGSDLVYVDFTSARNAFVSGDTLKVAAGTYTSFSPTWDSFNNNIWYQMPNGTMEGEDTSPANWPVFKPSSGTAMRFWHWNGVTRTSIILRRFKIDFSDVTEARACFGMDSTSFMTGFVVEDFDCLGPPLGSATFASGGGISLNVSGAIVRRGSIRRWSDNQGNPASHGLYWQGSGGLAEHLWIEDYNGYCLQYWNSDQNLVANNIFRYNVCKASSTIRSTQTGFFGGLYLNGQNNVAHNNVFINLGNGTNIGGSSSQNPTKFHHNTIYSTGSGDIGLQTWSSTACESAGNIIRVPNGTTNDNQAGQCIYYGSTRNLLTGTATDIWVDPSNDNFNLKEASAAIDYAATIPNFTTHQCTDDPDESNLNGACDVGAFEAPIYSSSLVESGDANTARITWSVPSQGVRDGTGVQIVGTCADNTPFTTTDNAASETETSTCTTVGTNRTDQDISGTFTASVTLTALYTRSASNYIRDNIAVGDPNESTRVFYSRARTWSGAKTMTNNLSGAPSVTWTSIHFRCLSYYSDTSPVATDWLRAEDASNATADTRCPIRAGGLAAVAMGVQVTGANPDNTTFAWFANRNGGAYSAMTNVVSSTTLAFAGNDASDPTTPLKDAADAEIGLTSPSAVCGGQVVAQQSSSPTLDCAQNDDVQVILVVRIGAAAVGDNFCIRAALSGQTETSVTATQFPCFQVVQPAAGL